MRIPQAIYDYAVKVFLKQYKSFEEPIEIQQLFQNHATADTYQQIQQYLANSKLIVQIKDPQFIKIILDLLEEIFLRSLRVFQKIPEEHFDNAITICNTSIKLLLLIKENTLVRDLFWSYDHLIDLISYHPEYDFKVIHQILTFLQYNLKNFTQNNICKLKIKTFERYFTRWLYLSVFFTYNIQCLSDEWVELNDYQKIFANPGNLNVLNIIDRIISFPHPSDDNCDYRYMQELLSHYRVLTIKHQDFDYKLNDIKPRLENPFLLTHQILKECNIQYSQESPLFDQIFVRLLSEFQLLKGDSEKELYQIISIESYNYLSIQLNELYNKVQIQQNEMMLIQSWVLADIIERLQDQKDFIVQIFRLLATKLKDERLAVLLGNSIKIQQPTIQDTQFVEKMHHFVYNVIMSTLNTIRQSDYFREKLTNTSQFPPLYEPEEPYHKSIIKQFFAYQFEVQSFKNFLKNQPNYLQLQNLLLAIIQNVIGGDTLQIDIDIVRHMISYNISLVVNASEQEGAIILAIIKLGKQACQLGNPLIHEILSQLNYLSSFFKDEYDRVALANAQSEHMVPLPDRLSRLLQIIHDEGLFKEYFKSPFKITTTGLQLLVSILSENPGRVRILYETGELQKLVEEIQTDLLVNSSNAQIPVINFLTVVCTNDQAAQIALYHGGGLIKHVFQNYTELSSDFAKKIIMLYSSSSQAKKQIEKVIESTFAILSEEVDLSQESIENIINNKLSSFYSSSKKIQQVLQIFERLHPERRPYRGYGGFEDFQYEESIRQKDQLLNSLFKNAKFTESLEKIIMSPILIGCKNKDQYVENFLTILFKKNKINPYNCLIKELKTINESYIIINGEKTLDMNQLVDYDTLSAQMSGRFFFRKILKHIKPQTYRGFYILSRFHLIHYLIRLCKGQPSIKANLLIEQFLEIYFLASQHAAAHESIMMSLNRKNQHFEEIRRQLSTDKLIPTQTSCLELLSHLHSFITQDQKSAVISKYSQVIKLFLKDILSNKDKLNNEDNLLKTLTSIQDLIKSLLHLIYKFFQLEPFTHIQFFIEMEDLNELIFENFQMVIQIDEKCSTSNAKFLPNFRDVLVQHSEKVVRELYFRKMLLDQVVITQNGKKILFKSPNQLEVLANELIISQAFQIKRLLDLASSLKMASNSVRYDSVIKNVLLEALIEKFFSVKDIFNQDMRKRIVTLNEVGKMDILNEIAQENKNEQQKKQSIFEREDIRQILEMVMAMGFSEKLAKKALKRIEIPEPTMIIDLILNGKISDDEESGGEEQNPPEEADFQKQIEELDSHEKDDNQELKEFDDKEFLSFIQSKFINYQDIPLIERIDLLTDDFKQHFEGMLETLLHQSYKQLSIQPLNNYSAQQQTVELLFRLSHKEYHKQIISQAIQYLSLDYDGPIDEIFSQMSMAFGQLAMTKRIFSAQYKQLYNDDILKLSQISSQLSSINLSHLIQVGNTVLRLIENFLYPMILEEQQALTSSEKCDKLSETINIIYEKQWILLEALFNEMNYASTQLQTTPQAEKLIARYWEIIKEYLEFIFKYLSNLSKAQKVILKTIELCNEEQRKLIKGRTILNRSIINQCLSVLNDFGLYHQKEIVEYLEREDILQQLINLKVNSPLQESEDQQAAFLENLINFIALDKQTIEETIRIQVKHLILFDHCGKRAAEINEKQPDSFFPPSYYIECPLASIVQGMPTLSRSPEFANVLLDKEEFELINQNTAPIQAPPLPQVKEKPSNNSQKSSEKLQAPQPCSLSVRWKLKKPNKYYLNEKYTEIVGLICKSIISVFYQKYQNFVNNNEEKKANYYPLFSWELLLKLLEIFMNKYPQTVLLIIQEKELLTLLMKDALLISPDRVAYFLLTIITESQFLSATVAHMLSKNILEQVLQFIKLDTMELENFYRLMQTSIVLTHLLISSQVSYFLTDVSSELNLIPKLMKLLVMIYDAHQQNQPMMFKFMSKSVMRILEPLFQVQGFHQQLRQGIIGRIYSLELLASEQHYDYYHQLRMSLFMNKSKLLNSECYYPIIPQSMFSTLKFEDQYIEWPPWLCKKIQAPQPKHKNQEEDASDSESDQDIQSDINVKNYQLTGQTTFQTFLGWQKEDINELGENAKDERNINQNFSINIFLNESIIKSNQNFTLPTINKTDQSEYEQNLLYTLVGFSIFHCERIEKKKTALNKIFENNLKSIIEQLKFQFKYIYNIKNIDDQIHLNLYLTDIDSIILQQITNNLGFNKFQLQIQKQPFIQAFPTEGVLTNALNYIYNNGLVILSKVPEDLNDMTQNNQLLLSSVINQTQIENVPIQLLNLDYLQIEQNSFESQLAEIEQSDENLVNILIRLFLYETKQQFYRNYQFLQIGIDTLKLVSKFSRICRKLVIMMVNYIAQNPEKKSDNLKLLFLISRKLPQNALQQFLPDISEGEIFQEEELSPMLEQFNSLTQENVIIQLLTIFRKLIQNDLLQQTQNSTIPIEKSKRKQLLFIIDLLALQLQFKSTNFHLQYIIEILKNTFIRNGKKALNDNQSEFQYIQSPYFLQEKQLGKFMGPPFELKQIKQENSEILNSKSPITFTSYVSPNNQPSLINELFLQVQQAQYCQPQNSLFNTLSQQQLEAFQTQQQQNSQQQQKVTLFQQQQQIPPQQQSNSQQVSQSPKMNLYSQPYYYIPPQPEKKSKIRIVLKQEPDLSEGAITLPQIQDQPATTSSLLQSQQQCIKNESSINKFKFLEWNQKLQTVCALYWRIILSVNNLLTILLAS